MITELYAITDPALLSPIDFSIKIEACLNGGCRLIQFRDKLNSKDKIQQARILRELCNQYQAKLIINDDLKLAREVGADGVHLGQDDIKISSARDLIKNELLIGATCHGSIELGQKAVDSGADYLAFGRFFPSQTKPSAPAASLSIIHEAKKNFDAPIVAIGGINRINAKIVIEHGADAIAVCHEIFSPNEPHEIEKRVKQYLQCFS